MLKEPKSKGGNQDKDTTKGQPDFETSPEDRHAEQRNNRANGWRAIQSLYGVMDHCRRRQARDLGLFATYRGKATCKQATLIPGDPTGRKETDSAPAHTDQGEATPLHLQCRSWTQ